MRGWAFVVLLVAGCSGESGGDGGSVTCVPEPGKGPCCAPPAPESIMCPPGVRRVEQTSDDGDVVGAGCYDEDSRHVGPYVNVFPPPAGAVYEDENGTTWDCAHPTGHANRCISSGRQPCPGVTDSRTVCWSNDGVRIVCDDWRKENPRPLVGTCGICGNNGRDWEVCESVIEGAAGQRCGDGGQVEPCKFFGECPNDQ